MLNSLLHLLGLDGDTRVSGVREHAWRLTEPLPGWLLALLIVLGLVLAVVNFLPQIKMRRRVRVYTFVLRLLMVLVLLLLFQQLELHVRLGLLEPQRWIVMVDDSASMATEDVDGRARFAAAMADARRIADETGREVKMELVSLSGAPLGDRTGKGPTPIREAITRRALVTNNTDRLVLLTDGRDTERRDLTQLGRDLKAKGVQLDVRLYGSQTPPEDSGVFAEPERAVIRLGEDLVVRGSVTGKMAGDVVPVRLRLKPERVRIKREKGEEEKTETTSLPKEVTKDIVLDRTESRHFILRHRPVHSGTYLCTVELPGTDQLALNNSYSFRVQVVDEKIKVLMIEGFPRFEFKLMKVALEVDPMLELATIVHIPGGGIYVQGKPQHRNPQQGLITSQSELFKYDVVILRDVSRQYFRAGGDTSESRLRNIVEFVTKRGGGLVVCGGQDVFKAGHYEDSALTEVLPFDLSNRYSKEAQFAGMFYVDIPKAAYSHPILRLLPDAAANRERLRSLRELDGSNNVGRFKPLATPLLTRTIELKTPDGKTEEHVVPIMAYQAVGEGKVVGVAVDTLWRWQLQPDFADPPLQALMANTMRYIAPPPRSRPGQPTVKLIDSSPQVGQDVILSTSLKDKNYDPLRKADLKVTVTLPDGARQHIYPRDLQERPGYYEYKIRPEKPGAYVVTAEHGGNEYVTSFVVESAASEYADLSADAESMAALTKAAGGTLVEAMDSWLGSVDTEPLEHTENRNIQAWNSPLMLLVLFALICADCYVRKREGLP